MESLPTTYLSELINSIKTGLLVLDTTGKVVSWNRWMERYSRITSEQAINAFFFELFPEAKSTRLGHAIEHAAEYGCPAVLSNILNPHPLPLWVPHTEPKRLIHQTIQVTPLRGEMGDGFCLLEVNDVTPAVLRQKSLEMQVLERKQVESALREAHLEVEQASDAKSQFLAVISHEVRTPLNGIIGMAQLMRHSEQLSEESQEQVSIIDESGRSLLDLINDILDYTKMESSKIELELRSFDVAKVVRQVCRLLEPRVSEKGVQFIEHLEVATASSIVKGDEARVRQVLYNLVGNAVKFTHTGDIRVSLKLTEGSSRGVTEAMIEVVDTGIGIPEDGRERLFQAFTQHDSSTSRKYGGTGLGLAITKQLVDIMSGSIELQSEVGQGTKFQVVLPFVAEEALEHPQPKVISERTNNTSDTTGYSGVRALVVDDDQSNILVACSMLRRLGIETNSAIDGQAALELLDEQNYSLILMDSEMPEMKGEEVARRIRQRESDGSTHTPIIALTGNSSPEQELLYREAGADAYLTKPLLMEALENELANCLPLAEKNAPYEQNESAGSESQGKHEVLLDYDCLNQMRKDLGEDFKDLIPAFITSCESCLTELSHALKETQYTDVRRLAHSIGSAAANVGAVQLRQLAKNLESKAENKEPQIFGVEYDVLHAAYLAVLPLLQKEY